MRPARTYDMLAAGTRTDSSLASVQRHYLLQRYRSAGVEVHQVGRVSLRVVVDAVDLPAAASAKGGTGLAAMTAAVRPLWRPPQLVVPCINCAETDDLPVQAAAAKAAIRV